MDTLPADSTPLPAHLNAWVADVWTVLSALDGLTLALIGVGVYILSLIVVMVDPHQREHLHPVLVKPVLIALFPRSARNHHGCLMSSSDHEH